MLDIRLVPWSSVVPGIILAVIISAVALALHRKRIICLALLALAPVAGWCLAVTRLNMVFPKFPPADAPHWAVYYSIFAVGISWISLWRKGCTGCIAILARAAYFPALWFGLFKPVFEWNASTITWKIIAFALIGMGIMGVWHKKAGRWASAEYAPWVLGLVAASMVLALTGTASVSLLALALAFTALPPALVMFLDAFRKHQLASDAKKETMALVDGEPVEITIMNETEAKLEKWRPPDSQSLTLPLALAFPALVCAGPLYASTPWGTACLILFTPVAGFLGLRVLSHLILRRDVMNNRRAVHWKLEVLAIIIALIAAAIPAGIAVGYTMKKAAEEEVYEY